MQEQWQKAEELLSTLVSFGKSKQYDHYTSFDSAIINQEAELNLAACKIKLGHLKEATALLTPLKSDPKTGPAARANLALIAELLKLQKKN